MLWVALLGRCNSRHLLLFQAIIEKCLGPSQKKVIGVFTLAQEVQISIFMTYINNA